MSIFGRRKRHLHLAAYWDGMYEACKCGVSAGDRRGPGGLRCVTFDEWDRLGATNA